MNKFLLENGRLSEDGKEVTSNLELAVQSILNSMLIAGASQAEIRTMGANIQSIIGNVITDHLVLTKK